MTDQTEKNKGKIVDWASPGVEVKGEVAPSLAAQLEAIVIKRDATIEELESDNLILNNENRIAHEKLGEAIRYRQRAKTAEAELDRWRNKEASVCPEDVGFIEYIQKMTAKLAVADEQIAVLQAEIKEQNFPCNHEWRTDPMKHQDFCGKCHVTRGTK